LDFVKIHAVIKIVAEKGKINTSHGFVKKIINDTF